MSKIKKMILTLIHIGMTLSISCFYTGYYFRFRKNSLHRIFNLFGAAFNLTTAFSLLYLKYLGGGLEKVGIVPAVERWIIDTHRVFALLALVLMLLMVWSGITRKKNFTENYTIFSFLYTLLFSFPVWYCFVLRTDLIPAPCF